MYDNFTTKALNVLQEKFSVSLDTCSWTIPQEEGHGDISTSIALRVAKEVGKKPQEIAQELASAFNEEDGVERTEVAGPGYVNLWFTSQELLRNLNYTREACTAKVACKNEPPVIIDYSGPNIAKPLGIHHILSTVIGQAIVNLYRHAGCNVVGWNYLGDWGTQFGKLAVAFDKWGGDKSAADCTVDELLALYVRFHEEVEQDANLETEARAAFSKLEAGDPELRAFWADVVKVSNKALQGLYERLHIAFDVETGESFYEDKMESILKEGIEKGVFTEGEEGSLIVQFSEESGLPPYLIRKGDGSTLYSTRDLAMIRYRLDEYKPQAVYYLVDVAQSLHFKQLEATCRKLGWDLPDFKHLVFGRMRFADQSMSTRKGTAIKLEDVLDESVKRADAIIAEHGDSIQTDDPRELGETMGIGSVIYGILSQNRKMDITFDWDRMLSFEGNSAPYLQYTHARARSVLRKAEVEDVPYPDEVKDISQSERVLAKVLLKFPQVLDEARREQMPHILTNYLHTLCQEYNTFYNVEPILKAQEPHRTLRLALTSTTATVLKTGAEILTMRVPDSM